METPRNEFLGLMNHIIERIKVIDDATPWQEIEPEWWIRMMDFKARARETKAALERREL